MPLKPAIHLLTSMYAFFAFMLSTVIVNMVDGQELTLLLATTIALIPAIRHISLMPNSEPSFKIALVGFCFIFGKFSLRHSV